MVSTFFVLLISDQQHKETYILLRVCPKLLVPGPVVSGDLKACQQPVPAVGPLAATVLPPAQDGTPAQGGWTTLCSCFFLPL